MACRKRRMCNTKLALQAYVCNAKRLMQQTQYDKKVVGGLARTCLGVEYQSLSVERRAINRGLADSLV